MILPAQTIRAIRPYIVEPFCERTVVRGKSFGLSSSGYDIRIDQDLILYPQGTIFLDPNAKLDALITDKYIGPAPSFSLASSLERFQMPNDVLGIVHDKSTWARMGIAVQNTVIEPGWCGHLTLELTNHGTETVTFRKGDPIAQIVFHFLLTPTEQPYNGKYQNQEARPVPAKLEPD